MAMIQVTASRLRMAAESLQNLNGQFRTKSEELQTTEQALGSMWEGEAQLAFHNAFTKDTQQMLLFYQLVEQYAQALLEIAERYELAESRNTELAVSRSY